MAQVLHDDLAHHGKHVGQRRLRHLQPTALVHPTGSSPGVFYMGVALFDGAGASISGDGTQWFYAASGQTLTTTWAAFEGEFGAGTARTFPSNARYMAPLVILSYAASDSRMECQGLRIDEKVGFSLIVNGGILADHLAANSIAVGTAAIQNGAIVNAMIANAAIDDAKIGSLSAAKVTFGVMDGARINVNTLNGDRIIAGTISAGAMNVASLSAISANLGTVTAGTLSAGTTFAGALSAATGTFSGLLNAATGTFAGALNAATGTFSGALVAASGTFAGNLTAVGGTLGSLTINAGGHIKQGQTAYNTGTGFWLGEDGGVTKLSLGVAGGASLRWSGSGLFINNASFEAFSASLDAGDLSVSVSYARQTYGSRTVTASGGVAPYSYVWVLNGVGMGVSGATAATATFSGEGNGVTNSGRAICFVTDANGRVTLAHCLVTALHAELPGGE